MISRLLREYVVRFPIARGKGFVVRKLAPRLPEASREFEMHVGSVSILVRWDEVVGRRILRAGSYESAELDAALAIVAPGDVVVDVGANIGLLTCPLASAVGPEGRVIAVEPVPENARRLRTNLWRNGLVNASVVEAAIAREDGNAALQIAQDPAFASLRPIVKYAASGQIEVAVRSLDSLWKELGRPSVALIKIDVEGAELEVIEGAAQLLEREHPALLIEADSGRAEEHLTARLAAAGYEDMTPAGFEPQNHLYR